MPVNVLIKALMVVVAAAGIMRRVTVLVIVIVIVAVVRMIWLNICRIDIYPRRYLRLRVDMMYMDIRIDLAEIHHQSHKTELYYVAEMSTCGVHFLIDQFTPVSAEVNQNQSLTARCNFCRSNWFRG